MYIPFLGGVSRRCVGMSMGYLGISEAREIAALGFPKLQVWRRGRGSGFRV